MPTGGSERANKQQRVASAVYAVDVHVFILSFIFYYMYITAPTQDATVLASKCPAARNSNDLCAFTTFLHSSLAPEHDNVCRAKGVPPRFEHSEKPKAWTLPAEKN